MKNLKLFNNFINESLFNKGDSVELKHNIEEDSDDGKYSYSIDKGEIGEIRYCVGDYGETPGREENIVYMVKFPDKDGKKRLVQLTRASFKKINEATENTDISPERVGEIINELKELVSALDDKSKAIEAYNSELNNYKTNSKKSNDQIDDSILALQIIKKDLDSAIEKTDTVINNLVDYTDKGRSFLYSQDKQF